MSVTLRRQARSSSSWMAGCNCCLFLSTAGEQTWPASQRAPGQESSQLRPTRQQNGIICTSSHPTGSFAAVQKQLQDHESGSSLDTQQFLQGVVCPIASFLTVRCRKTDLKERRVPDRKRVLPSGLLIWRGIRAGWKWASDVIGGERK